MLLLFLRFSCLLWNNYNLLFCFYNFWGGSSLLNYFRFRNFFNFLYFLWFWRCSVFYWCPKALYYLSFFRRLLFFYLWPFCYFNLVVFLLWIFRYLDLGVFLLWIFRYFYLGILLLWLFCWRNILKIIPTWFLVYQCFWRPLFLDRIFRFASFFILVFILILVFIFIFVFIFVFIFFTFFFLFVFTFFLLIQTVKYFLIQSLFHGFFHRLLLIWLNLRQKFEILLCLSL